MDFKHFSISDVGRVRQANEDNCGDRMTVNGYVFVVCDGMGGHVGGATASTMAVESILNYFENPVQNIIVGINDAFKIANNAVFSAAIENPELKGMGTTGTILIINNDACYVGHVGDSRIYLKSDGKLNRLTKDHSFVQNLVDQGIISDEEAEEHPKKNQILAAIGIKPEVNASVCEAPIHPKPGDCFLLCSDGLNGMIKDREIEDLISADELEISCRKLIDAANHAGGNDNVTATLVAITESPYSVSTFKHFNPVPFAATTIIEQRNGPIYGKTSKRNLLPLILGGIGAILGVFLIWFFVFRDDVKPPSDSDKTNTENSGNETDSTSVTDTTKIELPKEMDTPEKSEASKKNRNTPPTTPTPALNDTDKKAVDNVESALNSSDAKTSNDTIKKN